MRIKVEFVNHAWHTHVYRDELCSGVRFAATASTMRKDSEVILADTCILVSCNSPYGLAVQSTDLQLL
jgi:hypothetical protein